MGGAMLKNVQTTLVPAGGSTIVEFQLEVPGNYTLVDHSIFRIEKGAVGQLKVAGPEAPEIYKQFEKVVKSWEMQALSTSQQTKDFKL